MDYRRASLVVNKEQQATANSHIYASFAGAGSPRNTNGLLPENTTMWWDEERIEATVTRQYVLSNLRPDEQLRLDQQLGFGGGLTDDTYFQWIEQKAKRIFLILVDIGVPDQIFGVLDDSWDDEDLPVPLDQVERLRLTYEKDEKVDRRFFQRQFTYLLRNIPKGELVIYDNDEVVPLELAEKRPVGQVTGLTHSNVDKVHLPGRPDDLFLRRKIPLGVTAGRVPSEEFHSAVQTMKVVEHDHLACLWASYIHQECGYLLLTPVNDSTLKSFLNITPQSIKIMAKQDRRVLIINWLHCLADGLSFLHSKGQSHRSIKPSNIMLDEDNHIFLGDCGTLPTSTANGERKGFDKESYDYSAPEQAPRFSSAAPIILPNARPTMADIFSLGTIFLELLTFLLKRASRNFASHRSAKNKTPGRGGGLPDSSFHKNLGQVESWIATLRKDASKKEDKLFRGIAPALELIEQMLLPTPEERPTAQEVQERLYSILSEKCGLGQPTGAKEDSKGRIHCETRRVEEFKPGEENWSFNFDELRLASQRAAAAACASVAPVSTLSDVQVIYGVGMDGERVSVQSPPMSPRDGYGRDGGDRMSIATKTTSKSSEGKSRAGSGSVSGGGDRKVKQKAKAWQAPVYAEMSFG
ncbi:Mitogen-activated protein kinase pmk-1 [Lachnellula suecica]|uniref:Mitogen-activated protein kinase pmk-1 n=1 Tax=Lachnellula suecica TaxID=602035 RepID=A0A8T9C3P2_9HELO|nr:Mitogen-activated protein kinase pmk-1 [Lachnellula suecica]